MVRWRNRKERCRGVNRGKFVRERYLLLLLLILFLAKGGEMKKSRGEAPFNYYMLRGVNLSHAIVD
jgi:hypothetical protein